MLNSLAELILASSDRTARSGIGLGLAVVLSTVHASASNCWGGFAGCIIAAAADFWRHVRIVREANKNEVFDIPATLAGEIADIAGDRKGEVRIRDKDDR